jgi:hypothetical protein
MPFLAGASHMPYRRFLAYNAAGGLIWGTASVLLGYWQQPDYQHRCSDDGRSTAERLSMEAKDMPAVIPAAATGKDIATPLHRPARSPRLTA